PAHRAFAAAFVHRLPLRTNANWYCAVFLRVCISHSGMAARRLPWSIPTLNSLTSSQPIDRYSACSRCMPGEASPREAGRFPDQTDRKSARLNSSHVEISYAVFCVKKKIQVKQIMY